MSWVHGHPPCVKYHHTWFTYMYQNNCICKFTNILMFLLLFPSSSFLPLLSLSNIFPPPKFPCICGCLWSVVLWHRLPPSQSGRMRWLKPFFIYQWIRGLWQRWREAWILASMLICPPTWPSHPNCSPNCLSMKDKWDLSSISGGLSGIWCAMM